MLLGNLVGELPDVELSMRVQVTVAGSVASTLCDDEDAAGGGRRPHGPVVGAVTRHPRDRAACSVGSVHGAGQITRLVAAGRPAERQVIAARRVVARGHELRTARLVVGDVRGRVLRDCAGRAGAERPTAPDVLRTVVDRVRARHGVGIAGLGPVERAGLTAGDDRPGGDDPFRRLAVLEVRVAVAARCTPAHATTRSASRTRHCRRRRR